VALVEGSPAARRRALQVLAAVLVGGAAIGTVFFRDTTSTATTTTSAAPTTTTTVAREKGQVGWAVVSTSRRGVMVDTRQVVVGGVPFRVLRLRARTTLLRWHVGTTEPPGAASRVPADARAAIDWASEGLAGVVAVFNGGFKAAARAGGTFVDGLLLTPLVHGEMTIAINREGAWEMGPWGSVGFPSKGFQAISYRQNLPPLVLGGAVTSAGASANWSQWGSTINDVPNIVRTGLGIDAQGNLLFVASTVGATPDQLGRALVAVGARKAMQLDINPFWPIMGASKAPMHNGGAFQIQLNSSQHNASIYETGWTRDFFVAMAEPNKWSCRWASPGLSGAPRVRPQPLSLAGSECKSTTPTTIAPTSTAPTTTTS
jgi:hypothetical protein